MHNSIKILRSRFLILMTCLFSGLVLIGVAVADELPVGLEQKEVVITKKTYLYAGEASKKIRGLNPEHEENDRMVGLIEVKRPKRGKGQKLLEPKAYRFNGNTIVRAAKGKEVTMNDLLTPCKARIYFYPNARKAPTLYSIDMVGRYKGSNTKWNTDHKKE